MALVNMFIMYKKLFASRNPGKPAPLHGRFLEDLQVTLLGIGPSDFEGDISIESLYDNATRDPARPRSATPSHHELEQVESFLTIRVGDTVQRKRRQNSCKMCSMLRRH